MKQFDRARCRWVALFGYLLPAASTLVRVGQPAAGDDARLLVQAQRILREAPPVDGHNDLAEPLRNRVKNHLDDLDLSGDTGLLRPPMQTDVARLRPGGGTRS